MGRGRLDGRTAIVTGGARGLGRHFAEALAGEGAGVWILDIADSAAAAEAINDGAGADNESRTSCEHFGSSFRCEKLRLPHRVAIPSE